MDAPPATPGSAISEESMVELRGKYEALRGLYGDMQAGKGGAGSGAGTPVTPVTAGSGPGTVGAPQVAVSG